MLRTILSQWDNAITSLPFVERFGGLVRAFPVENNEGVKYYPVSCDVNQKDCLESGKYLDLMPNDNFKSVVYWEDLTGITFIEGTRRGVLIGNATVRLVCWLNLKDLGIVTCDGIDGMIINAIAQERNTGNISEPFKAGAIKLTPESVEPKTLDVFREYSYQGLEEMFFYPYDFFAIRFKVAFVIGKDCLPALDINPVECITL